VTDLLARLQDALSDRYRIERELGAGGMATVYLAHDLRHDRRVALKLLRPELASILGAERFLAEIKTTAHLQHPHILSLFDSGEAHGLVFYVMPYVEGESLRDRLIRERQLPVEEAVRIASDVADALEYAHQQGVVHRDIKPENILLHGGHALVADFGIAFAASRTDGATRLTDTGMSLGTPAYMAPEQAMGERKVTASADLYALGCVLYEMLVGEPPFTGPTAQAIIARVMTEAPRSLTLQRHTVPAQVEAAVRKALEKLPADRFASAKAFAEALANPAFASTLGSVATVAGLTGLRPAGWRARLRDPLVLGLSLGLAAAVIVAIGLARRRQEPPSAPTIRYVVTATDSARPSPRGFPWPAAMSPDGGTVVYTVATGTQTQLYALHTDQLEASPIPGTVGGYQPYFSPDGSWLAFEAAGKERKVRLDGSQPVTITDANGANGADWTAGDQIVLGAQGLFHGLSVVSAAGGEAVALTHPDTAHGERDHLWPIATPDGKTIVFAIWSGSLVSARLALTSVGDGKVVPLGLAGIRPLAVLDGMLVYAQADGAVMAVRLDAGKKRTLGRPFPVHDPVEVPQATNGNSEIFISPGGALVTARGGALGRLAWLRPGGRTEPVVPGVQALMSPRVAPDGRRIAVIVSDGGKSDVWIYDPALSTFSKLTSAGTVTSAEWSADGSRVVFAAASQEQSGAVWSQPASGGSPAEKLFEQPLISPTAVESPDGASLLVASISVAFDVFRVPLDSARVARPYLATAANEVEARFAPDGRWVALRSDESGRSEVYVRSFPDPSARIQISVAGGFDPVWSRDGRRLYYRAGTALLAARVALAPTFRLLGRDTLLSGVSFLSRGFSSAYDVSRDGKRILAIMPQANTFQLVVSPNWITEFRRRVAESRGR
jgi:Tol biopolymer transport system component/tRNA A-37 threonylcarbamoyl transferase component Bud32